MGFIVANLLVITKEVIPLVIALVLVSEAGIIPAIVLDPLSLLLREAGGSVVG